MNTPSPDLSIVVPVYNEADNVGPLLQEIVAALDPLHRTYEVLFIDDASTDGTWDALQTLPTACPALRPLQHTANHGQSAGMATGFAHARGSLVITLDGDGQNDPADIPLLLDALADDVDCVCGVRVTRRDRWSKRLSSRLANRFRRAWLGDTVTDAGCAFRVIRREALAELPRFNGMHRFLPTLLGLQGLAVREVNVSHRPRLRGQSKYGVHNRLWRGLYDCLAMRWYRRRCFPLRREAAHRGHPPS